MSLKIFFLLLVIMLMSVFTYFAFIRNVGYDTTMENLYKPSNNANIIADKIAKQCKGNETCEIIQVREYVANNVQKKDDTFFQNNFQWDNDFEYTYQNGNDCEGIAVFSAILLKNLNISNVYVFESVRSDNQRHSFIGVVRNNTIFLLNNFDSLEIVKAKKLW